MAARNRINAALTMLAIVAGMDKPFRFAFTRPG
jgi:hypothetical protein